MCTLPLRDMLTLSTVLYSVLYVHCTDSLTMCLQNTVHCVLYSTMYRFAYSVHNTLYRFACSVHNTLYRFAYSVHNTLYRFAYSVHNTLYRFAYIVHNTLYRFAYSAPFLCGQLNLPSQQHSIHNVLVLLLPSYCLHPHALLENI